MRSAKKLSNTWVLVADAARARIFRLQDAGGGLDPVWQLQLVGTNLPNRKIASDAPGRSFDSAGSGRHAMEPPTDPARYEQQRFAHDVAERLDAERKRQAFAGLIVVAPPQFLGDLRQTMSGPLKAMTIAELNKDLSKAKPAEIIEQLRDVL